MYLYETAMLVGRWQMLHKGHVEMIRHALDLSRQVVIFIGSAQEFCTEKNPFSLAVRKSMIEEVFYGEVLTKRLIVLPLFDIDVGDNVEWGEYVIDVYRGVFDDIPELYLTGCEKERQSWFTEKIAPGMNELRISRQTIKVSGTQCRDALAEGDFATWKSLVPHELHSQYKSYRSIIMRSRGIEMTDAERGR